MENMNVTNWIRLFLLALLCGLCLGDVSAQSGCRYAEPVFDEVSTYTAIPFSRAIREGDTLPTTLYFDFYEPQGDSISQRPLVITVFGGAFVIGSRDFPDMKEYCTRLAKHGYAAASIDYRLLPIRHLNYTSLIRAAYMAAQDVSAAIRFFKAHAEDFCIDPNQIFLLGDSAGSIAILGELFMDESERPVETFEAPDLGPMHSSGHKKYAGFSPAVAGAIPHWGGVIDPKIISSDEYVPLCLIHGTDDGIVPYEEGYCFSSKLSELMPFMYGSYVIASRLDRIGVQDYEFHPFEGEDHAFFYSAPLLVLNEKFDVCFNITKDFLYKHLVLPNSVPETGGKD